MESKQPLFELQHHSKLGIASSTISLLSSLLYCTTLMLVSSAASSEEPTQNSGGILKGVQEGDLGTIIGGVILAAFFFNSPFLSTIGLGLGIGGLFEKGKRKIFPIVGIVISSLLLLVSGGLALFAVYSFLTGEL